MKLSSIVSCLLVLLLCEFCQGASDSASSKVTAGKSTEKLSYPKKVSSLKKRPSKTSLKKVADITDKFKDLPADDLAFIKELDKQFKQHGGKVKIKVENDNATVTKNSKRTIEGELGYGYSHNGYEYNPPKYMFYPYSQQDISHEAPKYFVPSDEKTEVSIEPSYSYELKPQTYVTHNEPQIDVPQTENEHPAQQLPEYQEQPQHQHAQHQHQYEEPVIVLRIPGPAKYATHLQALLQQYLEIRAAQYLRILEEAEQRKQHQQHQQLQQLDYGHAEGGAGVASVEQEQQYQQHQEQVPQIPEQHDYQQQVEYDHQIAVTPQPVQYPEIDSVYHGYRHRHPSHPEQAQQPQPDQQAYYAPQQHEEQQQQQLLQQQHEQQQQQQHQYQQQQQEEPQFYYTHQQEYAQPEGPPANLYQHVYLVSMTPQSHPTYEEAHSQPEHQQPIYVPEHQQEAHHEHAPSVPISENNPRSSHTKVVFTHNTEHNSGDHQMYQLPSIKPSDRYEPSSVPDYHQDFQHQQQYQQLHGQQETQESVKNYEQHVGTAEAGNQDANTQRPYNYHAHSVKGRARGRTHKRRASSLKDADTGLQKIREYVREKLGAETGSAVEFKTTQVIDG